MIWSSPRPLNIIRPPMSNTSTCVPFFMLCSFNSLPSMMHWGIACSAMCMPSSMSNCASMIILEQDGMVNEIMSPSVKLVVVVPLFETIVVFQPLTYFPFLGEVVMFIVRPEKNFPSKLPFVSLMLFMLVSTALKSCSVAFLFMMMGMALPNL